ncbi:gtpase-activator protein for Ras family gtpase [Pelomyxa schiedti]|nr:gtpase-activator protein for Ras family gtpase [Pelomyxa schiedti]
MRAKKICIDESTKRIRSFALSSMNYRFAAGLEHFAFLTPSSFDTHARLQYDYHFKFLLVGDTEVGKHELVRHFSCNTVDFNETGSVNLTVQFYTKTLNLSVWVYDPMVFRHMCYRPFRETVVVIICFDLSDRRTFENLHNWYHEIQRYSAEMPRILIIGTKSELQHDVTTKEVTEACNSINSMYSAYVDEEVFYIETSSHKSYNVDLPFLIATNLAIKAKLSTPVPSVVPKPTPNPVMSLLSVAKQSLVEAVGRGDVSSNESFNVYKKSAKTMRIQLKNITAACERKLDERLQYASNYLGAEHMIDAFGSYATELGLSHECEVLGSALRTYSDIQRQLLNLRKTLDSELREQVVKPLNQFVDVDVKKMRNTKTQYYHIRKSYDSLRSKMRDLEAERKPDPNKLFLGHQETAAVGAEFYNIQTKTLSELEDCNMRRDFDVLSNIRQLLLLQSEYHRKSFALFKEQEAFIQHLQQAAEQAKIVYQDAKNKREEQTQLYLKDRYQHKYDVLVDLLSAPNLLVVSGLIDILPQQKADEVMVSVVRILDYNNSALPLVEAEISRQVQETTEPGTIFRGNTTATKLMTAFTKMIGKDYIISTLKPSLQYVIDYPDDYEIDPAKISSTESLETNIANLVQVTNNFFDHIIGSTARCPMPIRVICRHLRNEVSRKFDSRAGVIAVSGMMFLRFFCPNILAPTALGILPAAPPHATLRTLLLITKTMQNLVNYAELNSKEGFMAAMDDFIMDKRPAISAWYDQLTEIPQDWVKKYTPCASLTDLYSNDFPLVEDACRTNYKKLGKDLSEDKSTVTKLCQVLAHLEQCTTLEHSTASLDSSQGRQTALTSALSPTGTPAASPAPTPSSSPTLPDRGADATTVSTSASSSTGFTGNTSISTPSTSPASMKSSDTEEVPVEPSTSPHTTRALCTSPTTTSTTSSPTTVPSTTSHIIKRPPHLISGTTNTSSTKSPSESPNTSTTIPRPIGSTNSSNAATSVTANSPKTAATATSNATATANSNSNATANAPASAVTETGTATSTSTLATTTVPFSHRRIVSMTMPARPVPIPSPRHPGTSNMNSSGPLRPSSPPPTSTSASAFSISSPPVRPIPLIPKPSSSTEPSQGSVSLATTTEHSTSSQSLKRAQQPPQTQSQAASESQPTQTSSRPLPNPQRDQNLGKSDPTTISGTGTPRLVKTTMLHPSPSTPRKT